MRKNNFLFGGLILIIIGLTGVYIINHVQAANQKEHITYMANQSCLISSVPASVMKKRVNQKYSSNGERIYNTARSQSKKPIASDLQGMKMYSPNMSCVDCHKKDGKGGKVKLTGTTYNIPNITNAKLKKEGFNDQLLRKAIAKDFEPDGEHLKFPMPKWEMSEKDLDDLIKYLKTL